MRSPPWPPPPGHRARLSAPSTPRRAAVVTGAVAALTLVASGAAIAAPGHDHEEATTATHSHGADTDTVGAHDHPTCPTSRTHPRPRPSRPPPPRTCSPDHRRHDRLPGPGGRDEGRVRRAGSLGPQAEEGRGRGEDRPRPMPAAGSTCPTRPTAPTARILDPSGARDPHLLATRPTGSSISSG